MALSESVFLEAVRNVIDGEVLFKHMESILNHRNQFVAICKLSKSFNARQNNVYFT